MTPVVKFGTDGWRGIIADDFTFATVRVAAAAVANYVVSAGDAAKGICIGWDTRFASEDFAVATAEVLAAAGIPVLLADRVTPTPALSFAVRERGAAGGVMITSSHNPAKWNGFKYKGPFGGSATESIIQGIEARLGEEAPVAATPAKIERVNFLPEYLVRIQTMVDLPGIAASGKHFLLDPMYGAGSGVLAGMFAEHRIPFVEIRGERNPAFPGINPEPILPHIAATQRAVVANLCEAGLITDGDADRIGAVDEHGNVVDAHKIFSILLWWALERMHWQGEITRAFNTTKMIDRIAARNNRTVHEHGIGFKYVVDLMLKGNILMGGEESGGIGLSQHLPERDGILNSLLLAHIMATEKKTLGQLVAMLQDQFGEHHYGRVDMRIADALKKSAVERAKGLKEFAGMKILKTSTLDGTKFFLENPEAVGNANAAETWLLLRASGTEPLLRVYCESTSEAQVRRVLDEAQRFVLAGESA